jgi:chemotaxis signal transduction protein
MTERSNGLGCQALLVQVGERTAALPVDAIAEVLAAVAVTPAGPSGGIQGQVNVRGEVLPVVELRELLGESSHQLRLTDRMVLVDCQIGRMLLVVDEAVGIAWVSTARKQARVWPVGMSPATSGLDGQIVTLIDPAVALGPALAAAPTGGA